MPETFYVDDDCTDPADWARAFMDQYPTRDFRPVDLALWFDDAMKAAYELGSKERADWPKAIELPRPLQRSRGSPSR